MGLPIYLWSCRRVAHRDRESFIRIYRGEYPHWWFQLAGSTDPNPTHTYEVAGMYAVTLQASNAGEYTSKQKTGYVCRENLFIADSVF
ncbi:MAG: PKD domain-containing protein [Methanosarcina sp.]